MYHSIDVKKCLLSYILLVAIQCVNGAWHPPVLRRDGAMPERRQQCPPPAPNVDREQLFARICNSNPQNEFHNCFDLLVAYAHDSTVTYCARTQAVYNDCLVLKNTRADLCLNEKLDFYTCSDYTLQTYQLCFCYYQIPDDLYRCVNVIREFRPANSPQPTAVSTVTDSSGFTGVSTASLSLSTVSFSTTSFSAPSLSAPSLSAPSLPTLSASLPISPLTLASPYLLSSSPTPNPPNSLPTSPLFTQANPFASTTSNSVSSRTTVTLLSTYNAIFTTAIPGPNGVPVLATYTSPVTSTIIGVSGGTDTTPCTARITSTLRRVDL